MKNSCTVHVFDERLLLSSFELFRGQMNYLGFHRCFDEEVVDVSSKGASVHCLANEWTESGGVSP
jgi:hypothetical protein